MYRDTEWQESCMSKLSTVHNSWSPRKSRDTAQRTATIWSLLSSHYSRSKRICLAFCIYRRT